MANGAHTIVDQRRRFARYGIAGGVAAATHLTVLSALVEFGNVDKLIASVVGFSCAIPVNYLLQHRFVFSRRGRHREIFSRYLGVTLSALGLSTSLFWIGTELIGANYLLTQIVVIGIVVVVNFLVNLKFTFARKP